MATPYRGEFDNFFLTLPISRANYKASAHYTLRTGQAAGLPATFTPTLTSLGLHLDSFDENLTERLDPTAGTTEAFRRARKAWLTFVDDAMKDYVTPKLRKEAAYADFKKLTRNKLRVLTQNELITNSKPLLQLYADHAATMGAATLVADAQKAYGALGTADEDRDEQTGDIVEAGLALLGDREDIGNDLFAFKCQLHLRYPNDPDKVYSFFDFSKVRKSGTKKKKGDTPNP